MYFMSLTCIFQKAVRFLGMRERERFEVKFEVTENIEREAKGTSQWQALHIMALFMHRDARMAARTDFSVSETQAHDFFFFFFF